MWCIFLRNKEKLNNVFNIFGKCKLFSKSIESSMALLGFVTNLSQLSYTRLNKNIKIRHNNFMKYRNFTWSPGEETPARGLFPELLFQLVLSIRDYQLLLYFCFNQTTFSRLVKLRKSLIQGKTSIEYKNLLRFFVKIVLTAFYLFDMFAQSVKSIHFIITY